MEDEQTKLSFWKASDVEPLKWLQRVADNLLMQANMWDSLTGPCKDIFDRLEKRSRPDDLEVCRNDSLFFELNISSLYFMSHILFEKPIKSIREKITKEFKDCEILPNLLVAIGTMQEVDNEFMLAGLHFQHCLHFSHFSDVEEVEKWCKHWFGDMPKKNYTTILDNALKSFDNKCELTIHNYQKAVAGIVFTLETINKMQYSQEIRKSALAILGYCKLRVGAERYEEIQKQIEETEPKPPNLMTISVIAQNFCRTPRSIYRWIKSGKVKAYPDKDGRIMVDAKEVARYAERRK